MLQMQVSIDCRRSAQKSVANFVSRKNVDDEVIIHQRDNWISRFLYGGPIGLTFNFTVLLASTLRYCLNIRRNLNDRFFYEKIWSDIWLPSVLQLFYFTLTIDFVAHVLILFVLFPLSRVSRSTAYYCFIGVTCSSLMSAMLFVDSVNITMPIRILTVVDVTRLSMKVAAFLIECNRSERTYRESSAWTLAYFLFVPHLIYKTRYERSLETRWFKVFSHAWWIWVGIFPFFTDYVQLLVSIGRFDVATDSLTHLAKHVAILVSVGIFSYPVVVWFFFFENFCGLHGELTRFPHFKLFGDFSELFVTTRCARAINTVVSDWFSVYVHAPTLKSSGSRYRALFYTVAASALLREVCCIYTFHVFITLNLAVSLLIAAPLMMSCRENRFVRNFASFVSIITALIAGVCYSIEYIARNYSSIPEVQSTPWVRFFPIHITFLLTKHLALDLDAGGRPTVE